MVPQDHFLQDGKSRTTQKWRQSEREVKISFVIIEFKSQDASISTHAKTTSSAIDRHTGNEKFRTETVNIAKIKIIDQQKRKNTYWAIRWSIIDKVPIFQLSYNNMDFMYWLSKWYNYTVKKGLGGIITMRQKPLSNHIGHLHSALWWVRYSSKIVVTPTFTPSSLPVQRIRAASFCS